MTPESDNDILYMHRALELARLGNGNVAPNPMVGCVIVRHGKIIGEGWHARYGEPHAEVNAVKSVKEPSLLKGSTAYVTLEPCSHFGKTPPCADLLITHGIKKVVVACEDPNPLVAGKGLEKLRQAGIEVVTDVLKDEVRMLNNGFMTFHEKKRPYILLKWAQTADGFIAREDYDSKWISDEYSRQLVHKWRSETMAILVGHNTVRHDNPRLNIRDWTGRDPVRLILDRNVSLKENYHVFDHSQPTLYYNTTFAAMGDNLILVKIDTEDFIRNVLSDLVARRIQSVLVEGGAQILNSFLAEGLWDEARVFTSNAKFGNGIPAPKIDLPYQEEQLKNDTLRVYFNR